MGCVVPGGGGNLDAPLPSTWDRTASADFGPAAPEGGAAQEMIDHLNLLLGWLDGHDRTDVFLGEPGSARYLIVSGGNAGRYVIVVQEPDGSYTFHRQLDPAEPDEPIAVCVGGLPADYPPSQVHPLSTARMLAVHYFLTGSRCGPASWVCRSALG